MDGPAKLDSGDREAILGLWAVPGVGPKALETLGQRVQGRFGLLRDRPPSEWAGELPLNEGTHQRLCTVPRLSLLAERLQERCRRRGIRIAFAGDEGYPPNLVGVPDAPPLLFWKGEDAAPRRRVAMVGSRVTDNGFELFAERFAYAVALTGLGIISGAADGIDRACHLGAVKANGETWAFVGSGLDQLDPPQAELLPDVLEKRGRFYSELPPGVRANKSSFPRRNRLISGASDAVLVVRARAESGSLYTAMAALAQGRPLLALPGEITNPAAEGSNELLWTRKARLCRGVGDVAMAAGLVIDPPKGVRPRKKPRVVERLSFEARRAYDALTRMPKSFDEVRGACALEAAALTSALCELELSGLALQHPGKLYERI